MIEVLWSENYKIDEAYPVGVKMALASSYESEYGAPFKNAYAQKGPFTTCRDFFADAIRASLHGFRSTVYGYRCNFNVPLDKIRMLVAGVDPYRTITLVNDVAHRIGITDTDIYHPVKNERFKTTLFEGPVEWMLSPQLLSLWTYLLRNGTDYNHEGWREYLKRVAKGETRPGCPNDAKYAPYILQAIEYLGEYNLTRQVRTVYDVFGWSILDNYPKGKRQSRWQLSDRTPDKYFHENSGIISFMWNDGKEMFPHYRYPEPVTGEAPEWLHN